MESPVRPLKMSLRWTCGPLWLTHLAGSCDLAADGPQHPAVSAPSRPVPCSSSLIPAPCPTVGGCLQMAHPTPALPSPPGVPLPPPVPRHRHQHCLCCPQHAARGPALSVLQHLLPFTISPAKPLAQSPAGKADPLEISVSTTCPDLQLLLEAVFPRAGGGRRH